MAINNATYLMVFDRNRPSETVQSHLDCDDDDGAAASPSNLALAKPHLRD